MNTSNTNNEAMTVIKNTMDNYLKNNKVEFRHPDMSPKQPKQETHLITETLAGLGGVEVYSPLMLTTEPQGTDELILRVSKSRQTQSPTRYKFTHDISDLEGL